jgi:hypothetical protein
MDEIGTIFVIYFKIGTIFVIYFKIGPFFFVFQNRANTTGRERGTPESSKPVIIY